MLAFGGSFPEGSAAVQFRRQAINVVLKFWCISPEVLDVFDNELWVAMFDIPLIWHTSHGYKRVSLDLLVHLLHDLARPCRLIAYVEEC